MAKKECLQMLQKVHASLRAAHWAHWTAHWQCKGSTFYGDHLMMERLYEMVASEIDQLAEKLVCMYGEEAVAAYPSMELTYAIMTKCEGPGSNFEKSLRLEEHLQVCLEETYEHLEQSGEMTLGMDNFLQGVSDAHETNLYLLRQKVKGQPKAG